MNVQVHLAPEVERRLRRNASTEGMTLEVYLDALVARAAGALPAAEALESASGADDDRPWRGVFVPPRPQRGLFSQAPELPMADLPRRPAVFNMNWHRVSNDDE